MRRAALASAALLILALALGLRLEALGRRPMHADEAVHGLKLAEFAGRTYRYDAHEFHGPTLYLLALPLLALQGERSPEEWTEAGLRFGPALCGAALALLPFLLVGLLGLEASLWAALLAALSPGLVSFSRSFIQESLFILLTGGLLAAACRHGRRPSMAKALAAGLLAGAALATKETALIAFLALALAWAFVRPLGGRTGRPPLHPLFLGLGLLGAAAACAGLLSGLGADPGAPGRLLAALGEYAHRGMGSEGAHVHPWHYYLGLLIGRPLGTPPRLTELPLLGLAAAGLLAAAAAPRRDPRRLIALYALLLALCYTLLPYKTPWCMGGFLHGFTLLGGMGAAFLAGRVRPLLARVPVRCALLALLVLLGLHARRAAIPYAADHRNPYVYAQTVPDAVRLAERVAALARLHPEGERMPVQVVAPGADYWPLPWYLRGLTRVGWWSEPPERPDAPVLIAAASLAEALQARLPGDYHASVYGLRPGVLLQLFVERPLWDAFLETVAAGPAEPPPAAHRFFHATMGSPFEIRFAGYEDEEAARASAAAFALLDRLEEALSRFREGSDISRLRGLAPGKLLPIGEHTHACLLLAGALHDATWGAFDPALGSGWEKLRLHDAPPAAELLAPGPALDLGGIAKGYAVDQMARLLETWGLGDFLISAGHSSVAARGAGPNGAPWRVRLADPRERARTLRTVLLQGRALGASGLATRPGHILDPRTGRPAGRLAAFALAPTAAEADALSTAFMLLTRQEVQRLCADRPGAAALLVERDGTAPVRIGEWEEER